MQSPSHRRQWIQEWLQSHLATVPVAEPELRGLQAEFSRAFPGRRVPPLEELAEIIHESGRPVRYGDLSGTSEDDILHLDSLDTLEAGLRELQGHLERARQSLDRDAVERARRAARRSRHRALRVAANGRAAGWRRAEKQEMADWLLLWLEMPEAFFEWLLVRKRTRDFHGLLQQISAASSPEDGG